MFSCVFTEERIASGHTGIKPRLVECVSLLTRNGVTPGISPFCRVPVRLIWSISPLSAAPSICPGNLHRSSCLPFIFLHKQTLAWLCQISTMTQCISVWYNNATNQDCKALQRVVRLAERISGSALPSLQHIYLKRCRSRAAKIIKDSTHPGNHLFCLLPSGRRFRSMMAKTERLRKSFFPQAIRFLNTNSVS